MMRLTICERMYAKAFDKCMEENARLREALEGIIAAELGPAALGADADYKHYVVHLESRQCFPSAEAYLKARAALYPESSEKMAFDGMNNHGQPLKPQED